MTGLFMIIIASLVAIAGYLIMPDPTPDANDGAVQIQKKPPGFSMLFIKIKKNINDGKKGWIMTAIGGNESPFHIIPVNHYTLKGWKVIYEEYGREGIQKEINLINAVFPVYIGDSKLMPVKESIRIEDDQAWYVSPDLKVNHISLEETVDRFEAGHIERRHYWLGTDRSGRDMLSRLIYGTRISLSIGFVAVLISMFLGLGLGALAGFFGGRTDNLILWFMSVVWSIPGIMLVIAISIALQSRGVWVAFVAVGLTMWVDVARVIRGQIMTIKEKTFVEAARAMGIRDIRIVYVHILPNIIGPLIVIATANFAAAILLEAGLSFLGLSVQPPTPSWGSMIFEGFNVMGTKNSWHLVVFPGLAISLMVLSFNLLGNGLRDAIDPKTISRS